MKFDDSAILLLGLFLIAFVSSTYCYEPPVIPLTVNPTAYIDPWIKNRRPEACFPITNQQDDPPSKNYAVTYTTTSGFQAFGTSGASGSTTTTI